MLVHSGPCVFAQFTGVCESDAFAQAATWLREYEENITVIGLNLSQEPETGNMILVLTYEE